MWKGLEPLINTFMQYGLLRDCQSESILLPVKKLCSEEFRRVQNLRAITQPWTHTLLCHSLIPCWWQYLKLMYILLFWTWKMFCLVSQWTKPNNLCLRMGEHHDRKKGAAVLDCASSRVQNQPYSGNLLMEEQWWGNNNTVALLQYMDDIDRSWHWKKLSKSNN